jgi:nicotinamidase/pyrazinamidase
MKALLIIDIQNDFLPGGALPVPKGHEVIPIANELQSRFELVVASQDWHPRDHASFAANHPGAKPGDTAIVEGVPHTLWPVHCVQNTQGAAFAPTLKTSELARVFQKGVDPNIDSYSAFFDIARRKETGLDVYLKECGVTEVYALGLALDYCVKYSVLDAQTLGFRTYLIADGCRGIGLGSDDVRRALTEMTDSGAYIVDHSSLL